MNKYTVVLEIDLDADNLVRTDDTNITSLHYLQNNLGQLDEIVNKFKVKSVVEEKPRPISFTVLYDGGNYIFNIDKVLVWQIEHDGFDITELFAWNLDCNSGDINWQENTGSGIPIIQEIDATDYDVFKDHNS